MRNLKSLDLNLLKTFDALLDERSVTRAAERLSLTQPAVSSMLTRLRESFDDPLFVRARYGIVPTERALALAKPVKRVMAEIDALLQPEAFVPAECEMTFTLAATDYALSVIIVPFFSLLRQRAPGIHLSVQRAEASNIQERLERGEVDLALLTPETTPPDLHIRHLYDERYVCTLRKGHPALDKGTISLGTFCHYDHALVSLSGENFAGVTDTALRALGKKRNVVLSVNSFLVLPPVLQTTDLIAVVPERLVRDAAGLEVMAPPLDIPGFTKVAAWHERSHLSPAHQWLRQQLAQVCSGQ